MFSGLPKTTVSHVALLRGSGAPESGHHPCSLTAGSAVEVDGIQPSAHTGAGLRGRPQCPSSPTTESKDEMRSFKPTFQAN